MWWRYDSLEKEVSGLLSPAGLASSPTAAAAGTRHFTQVHNPKLNLVQAVRHSRRIPLPSPSQLTFGELQIQLGQLVSDLFRQSRQIDAAVGHGCCEQHGSPAEGSRRLGRDDSTVQSGKVASEYKNKNKNKKSGRRSVYSILVTPRHRHDCKRWRQGAGGGREKLARGVYQSHDQSWWRSLWQWWSEADSVLHLSMGSQSLAARSRGAAVTVGRQAARQKQPLS